MIASEITSGKPKAQTFAGKNLFLAVETDNEKVIVDEIISQVVDKISSISEPTLTQIVSIVDSTINSFHTTLLLSMNVDNVVHLVTRGKGTIFLKRGTVGTPLLAENASATGSLLANDVFIFAPPSFLLSITPSVFTILLGKTKGEDIEKYIVSYLEQNAKTDTLSLLVQNPHQEKQFPIKEIEPTHEPRILPFRRLFSMFSPLSPHTKQRKLTLAIGILLLLVLIASLAFGNRQRNLAKTKERFEEIKTSVLPSLTEAEQVVEVSPEQAEPLLTNVESILTSAINEFDKKSQEYKEIEQLQNKTKDLTNRARRIFFVHPDVFFDIKWVKETGIGKKIVADENTLFILDTDTNNIYSVGLSQKKAEVLATNSSFHDGKSLILFGKSPFVFVEGNDPHMINQKGETIIPHADTWGVIVDTFFYGGNVYLLDKNGAVWKHSGTTEGFGSGSNWIRDESKVDFTQANSFAIDGNVWILKNNELLKLAVGGVDSFFLKGESIQNGKGIWTSENSNLLYIRDEERIVAFDKQGKYIKQYVAQELSQASDFLVSEKLNKILFVVNSTIYSIDTN